MPSKKPFISLRVSPELNKWIIASSKKKGIGKSEFVNRILEKQQGESPLIERKESESPRSRPGAGMDRDLLFTKVSKKAEKIEIEEEDISDGFRRFCNNCFGVRNFINGKCEICKK